MVKHETPDWMDELLDRYEISWREYWDAFLVTTGLTRSLFWTIYYGPTTDQKLLSEFFKSELETSFSPPSPKK